MTISYPTQWDAGDDVHGVPMLALHTTIPITDNAKWTLSNFTISGGGLDALAVAAASYAQRYIPGVVQGHLQKVTGVLASISGTATNEVQTVMIDDLSSGGTFTLTYEGQETGTIAYNAAAAAVKSALELLSNINLVSVTGGPGPATDWVIEFQGTLAGQDVGLLVGDGALLTGGTTDVTVTETTPGAAISLVVTMGGKAVGTVSDAGTFEFFVRPDDGLPLKITTPATSTSATISSITVENVDPINLDLIPEVAAVQV